MPQCPDCGNRHDSKAGVAQHMVMSNDHDYETRDDAWGAIFRNESPEGTSEGPPGESNEEGNVTESNESGQSGGGARTNPVIDGPDANPRENADRGGDSEDKACPQCEGELYDFASLTNGEYHKVNGEQVYVRGDYQCSECGKWWVDE